jgi:hypothetical protein
MPASGNKPSSTTSSSNGSNNIPLDPSLGLASSSSQMQQGHSSNSAEGRPSPRPGQPSFLKNTGDSTIRTPGPGQLVSPKQAFNDYEDMVKRQQRGSHQPIVQQQQQQGSPQLQQQGQFKHPQQQRPQAGDIQVPQMNLPQMPQPQQAQAQQQQQHLPPVQQQQHHHQQLQNAFQAQTTAPPIPPTGFDGTDAQLLAALGAQQQRPAGLQGSPHQQQQQRMAPQQQQQQQQQRPMGQQGSPRQQFQTQPVPQAMTAQQQNAARQAAYQGFMAQPPPPPTAGAPKNSNNTSSSTDIQVPQAVGSVGAGITSNVGTPSAGQSSLPPLPNYQSAPVPLGYGDGSFFSHQAILASLAAEENAKAAAAAAAVMGFQNGNWNAQNGGGAVGGGQQQQPFPGYNAGQQQPQQSGQQAGLPPFAAPGTSSVLGDFSFEQHFGPPPPAGNASKAAKEATEVAFLGLIPLHHRMGMETVEIRVWPLRLELYKVQARILMVEPSTLVLMVETHSVCPVCPTLAAAIMKSMPRAKMKTIRSLNLTVEVLRKENRPLLLENLHKLNKKIMWKNMNIKASFPKEQMLHLLRLLDYLLLLQLTPIFRPASLTLMIQMMTMMEMNGWRKNQTIHTVKRERTIKEAEEAWEEMGKHPSRLRKQKLCVPPHLLQQLLL